MTIKWKNIKLGKKFGIGFGMVIFLLLIVAIWSIGGISSIVRNAKEVIDGNQLNGLVAEKEVDHLNWVNKVNALLTDDKVTELDVQTDDHECGFGKWLYGEGRKQAEQLVPDLKPLLKEIETPHRHLHESAIAIKKHFKQADEDLPANLLTRIIDHLNWAADIRDTFLNGENRLDVQTDPKLCNLGKWLQSDEARKIYSNADAKFKADWDEMVRTHQSLHQSAKTIQSALNESPEKAVQLFEQSTLPLLSQTVERLTKLRESAENDLDGMHQASDIYSTETLPALKSTQELLNRIKIEVKNHMMTDEQMLAAAVSTRTIVIVLSAIATILGILLSLIIAKGIVGPLKKGVSLARSVAQGDLTQSIDLDQADEIGDLALSMRSMTENLNNMMITISTMVNTMAASSEELSATAQEMSAGSEQTTQNSSNVAAASEEMSMNMRSVAAAAEQASQNVGIVATASEEMSSTIQEIAQNTERGRSISSDAVQQTTSASEKMSLLGQAAKAVDKVTETITEISEQTNLLALNATIEAARAGEAGKGFAIVANEIKDLAKQTAEATQAIRKQIGEIQGSTLNTISEIQHVTGTINQLNDIVDSIASAIEEQSIATKEIAGNVAQAANGIQEVTQNVTQASNASEGVSKDISQISYAAQEFSSASSQVRVSAEQVTMLSEQLREMVDKFKLKGPKPDEGQGTGEFIY